MEVMEVLTHVIDLLKVLLLPVIWFILRELRLLADLNHKLDIRVVTLEVLAGVRKPSRSVFPSSSSMES